MRILYVSGGFLQDYQCDMLFHGLRTLLGADVIDVDRLWFMYKSEFARQPGRLARLYGKGFSIYATLEDLEIDRTDIETKIRKNHFDIVIFGSITRCRSMIEPVLEHYPPSRIVFIDGQDEPHTIKPLLGRGFYFKRELQRFDTLAWPIQFGFPAEKIGTATTHKTRLFSYLDPRDRTTYVYDDERSYYAGYAESFFGVTMRKGGWDCLRHYEIIANGCIPYFIDIEQCPEATMVFMPKFELLLAREMADIQPEESYWSTEGRLAWEHLNNRIATVFRRRCTTTAIARYVLDVVGSGSSSPLAASHMAFLPWRDPA